MEEYLIEHCAPTLASIKTASLFTMGFSNEKDFAAEIEYWNTSLAEKGIVLLTLRKREQRALIYVCRKSHLRKDLSYPGVARFLDGYGYGSTEVDQAIETLKGRMKRSEEFPHEIGIFLGYPLGDVIGFIQNAGQNYKCAGCWKVYCNECEAIRRFALYKKCKEIYRRLWKQGKSVQRLTVAA